MAANAGAEVDLPAGIEQLGPDLWQAEVTVVNAQGLHARPALKLVEVASKFAAKIHVRKEQLRVDAKSMIQLLSLVAECGTKMRIEAQGEDAKAALDALRELFATGFHNIDAAEPFATGGGTQY